MNLSKETEQKIGELQKMEQNPQMYVQLKQLEIEMERLKVWDGRYPTYLFQNGAEKSPSLLLSLPQPAETSVVGATPQ